MVNMARDVDWNNMVKITIFNKIGNSSSRGDEEHAYMRVYVLVCSSYKSLLFELSQG